MMKQILLKTKKKEETLLVEIVILSQLSNQQEVKYFTATKWVQLPAQVQILFKTILMTD
jgi:hypothetical protein